MLSLAERELARASADVRISGLDATAVQPEPGIHAQKDLMAA